MNRWLMLVIALAVCIVIVVVFGDESTTRSP